MYEDDPTIFQDITIGNNICSEEECPDTCRGFYCTTGWDPVTGLGTPNVKVFFFLCFFSFCFIFNFFLWY